MTTPSTRSRRGPLLILVIAFIALLAIPVVLATVGVDEERDAAGAAGTTTEVPTSAEATTTSEPATTTTGSAPTTTEAPVPETTTTTVDMSAVYTYAAALERAKATPPTTTAPAPVVEYVEVPVYEAPAPEPVYEEPAPEPVYEAPPSVEGDPFDGLSWSDRQFLECVKNRESGGDYTIVNPSSGAGGAYQFLQNTWNNTASHAGRGDLVGLPPQYASAYDQDFLAAHLLMWYGRSPWSYSC